MARIRSVKPEFWDDEELADLPRDARLLYIGLWNQADEHGRLRGNPKWVKGKVFPYDDDLDVEEVDELLEMLAIAGKVVRYTVGGKAYMHLPNLAKHQRLEAGKVESKLPGPDEADPEPEPDRALGGDSPAQVNAQGDDSRSSAQINPGESAPRGADESALLYGTGSMEHVYVHRAEPANVHADEFELDEPLTEPTYEIGSDDDPKWREFWSAYPRNGGKQDARRTYRAAVTGEWTEPNSKRKRPKVDPDDLIAAARSYSDRCRAENTATRHIKMAQGWINAERFRDELEAEPEPVQTRGVDIWA